MPKHPFPTYDSICHIALSSHYISGDIMNVSQKTPFSVRQGTAHGRPIWSSRSLSTRQRAGQGRAQFKQASFVPVPSTPYTVPHRQYGADYSALGPGHSCEGGLRPARHLALRAGWVVKRVQTRVHHLQIPPCDMRQTSPWLDGAAMPKLESCGLPFLAWALTRSCTVAAAVLLAQHLMLRTA